MICSAHVCVHATWKLARISRRKLRASHVAACLTRTLLPFNSLAPLLLVPSMALSQYEVNVALNQYAHVLHVFLYLQLYNIRLGFHTCFHSYIQILIYVRVHICHSHVLFAHIH